MPNKSFRSFGFRVSRTQIRTPQFIAAAMMHPGDVAVAISNTGQTVGIIQVARVARKNGATVIGISGRIAV